MVEPTYSHDLGPVTGPSWARKGGRAPDTTNQILTLADTDGAAASGEITSYGVFPVGTVGEMKFNYTHLPTGSNIYDATIAFGFRDEAVAAQKSGLSGFYGVVISPYSNYFRVVNNGTEVTTPSQGAPSEFRAGGVSTTPVELLLRWEITSPGVMTWTLKRNGVLLGTALQGAVPSFPRARMFIGLPWAYRIKHQVSGSPSLKLSEQPQAQDLEAEYVWESADSPVTGSDFTRTGVQSSDPATEKVVFTTSDGASRSAWVIQNDPMTINYEFGEIEFTWDHLNTSFGGDRGIFMGFRDPAVPATDTSLTGFYGVRVQDYNSYVVAYGNGVAGVQIAGDAGWTKSAGSSPKLMTVKWVRDQDGTITWSLVEAGTTRKIPTSPAPAPSFTKARLVFGVSSYRANDSIIGTPRVGHLEVPIPPAYVQPGAAPKLYLGSTKIDKLKLGEIDITTAYLTGTKL